MLSPAGNSLEAVKGGRESVATSWPTTIAVTLRLAMRAELDYLGTKAGHQMPQDVEAAGANHPRYGFVDLERSRAEPGGRLGEKGVDSSRQDLSRGRG